MTISTLGPNFPIITATGGIVNEINDGPYRYRVHVFNASGTFDVTVTNNAAPFASAPIEYLVVAGGAGAGAGQFENGWPNQTSGGGGAGGYLEGSIGVISGSYSVIVGAGGANGVFNTVGSSGSNSSVLNIVARGGGGSGFGRGDDSVARRSLPGGSGGGSPSGGTPANWWGEGTFGQGHRGGAGWDGISVFTAAGGGGGAGGVGADAPTQQWQKGADGGPGKQSSITGVATFYAGGGGGGQDGGGFTRDPGLGGAGGGGNGGSWNLMPTAGRANTGGGGGGNAQSGAGGAAGGSGVVILRYPIGLAVTGAGPIDATGGTVTTITVGSDTYKVHTFTTSGAFTVLSGTGLLEYLVIGGGGGGGGATRGGGGGAGGYRCSVVGEASGGGTLAEARVTAVPGTYPVIVGAGGASGPYDGTWEFAPSAGLSGGNSRFSNIESFGGGGGGFGNRGGADRSPKAGGSGGGGFLFHWIGGAGFPGQGFSGGDPSANPPYSSGGGGAAVKGGNAAAVTGGIGGDGVSSSINGTATFRAGGGSGSDFQANSGWAGGAGGGGVGRNALNTTVGQAPSNGAASTGSGGGASGNGGSGIVIIRYLVS